jgi:Invasion associated locus B (IalB) protein
MKHTRLLLSAFLALSATGALAQGAAKPTLVGTFNKWTMWSYTGSYGGNGEGKVCYIYSEPDKMDPPKLDHGRVSFSITTSPSEGITDEANFVTGYTMKEQSSVTVQIGDKSFTMFTQGDSAWLVNKEEEPALLDAMKSGSTMVVKATSRRGNDTTYSYSLSGVTAAADKMRAECK